MAEADRDNEDDEDEDVVEEKAVMTEEVIEGIAAAAEAAAEAEAAIGIGSGLEDEDFGLSSDDLCSWHSAGPPDADDDVVGGSLRTWSVLVGGLRLHKVWVSHLLVDL